MKTGCIYGFIDEFEKFFYVGQTINIKKRLYGHAFELRRNNKLYFYRKFQKLLGDIEASIKSIQKYIVIIEDNIPYEYLDEREVFHIKRLREDGYSLTNLTDGGRRWEAGPSKEQRKKISLAHLGKKRSLETRMRMSAAQKGKFFSEETRKKMSIARRKRVLTAETRKKLSSSNKGKIHIKKFILTDPYGNEFVTEEGLTKFCEDHGLTSSNMHKVLNGTRENHKGWKIRRYTEEPISDSNNGF